MTILKTISTIGLTTACNVATAAFISQDSIKINENFFESNEFLCKLLVGFAESTLPAIGLNVVNQFVFKEFTDNKVIQYAGMGTLGFFAKDKLLDICVRPKANIGEAVGIGFGIVLNQATGGQAPVASDFFDSEAISNSMKYHITAENKTAFSVNAAVQTLAIDWIWSENTTEDAPELLIGEL